MASEHSTADFLKDAPELHRLVLAENLEELEKLIKSKEINPLEKWRGLTALHLAASNCYFHAADKLYTYFPDLLEQVTECERMDVQKDFLGIAAANRQNGFIENVVGNFITAACLADERERGLAIKKATVICQKARDAQPDTYTRDKFGEIFKIACHSGSQRTNELTFGQIIDGLAIEAHRGK